VYGLCWAVKLRGSESLRCYVFPTAGGPPCYYLLRKVPSYFVFALTSYSPSPGLVKTKEIPSLRNQSGATASLGV
jgi:hypothetical protein